MPTLPTRDNLGPLPSARSGRVISAPDVSAVGRGLAVAGSEISQAGVAIGKTLGSGGGGANVPDNVRFSTHTGFLDFESGQKAALTDKVVNAPVGAQGLTEQAKADYVKAAKQFMATVPDALKPEYDNRLFKLETEVTTAARKFALEETNRFAKTKIAEGENVLLGRLNENPADWKSVDAEAETLIRTSGRAPIDADTDLREWRARRAAALWQVDVATNGPAARARLGVGGPVAPVPADVQSRANRARDRLISHGWTPQQAAGIVGNLVQESGVRSDGAVGDQGTAFGMAQWRGERLTRLKRFANANGKDWKDFDTQVDYIDMELKNHETDAAAKLKASSTVEEATAAFIGYERPAGWTPGNPRGGHGWANRLAAAQRTAGEEVNTSEVAPEYADLPYENRVKLFEESAVEMRGQIEIATQNAPAAIQNTGAYSGRLPTADDFIDAYGPQDGAQRFNTFAASVDVAEAAHSMQTQPAADIAATLAAARPTSSGDDAALQQKKYEVLSSAADATLKAREADPAQYVRRAFPSVDAAWDEVEPGEKYQAAVALSIAAQRQLGISEIKPLPADATKYAVDRFNNVEAADDQRMNAIVQVLAATSDSGQQKILFDQLVDAGVPEIVEGAVAAYMRGDSSAAMRLFKAGVTDPSKLPGELPVARDVIDGEIQRVMDTDAVGDLFYGLSDGTAANLIRAERDSRLLYNAVALRLRGGESLSRAVEGSARDLFGDVQPVVSGSDPYNDLVPLNARLLLSRTEDPTVILHGLSKVLPQVEEAVRSHLVVPADAPTADGTRAVLEATSENYVGNLLAEGYFANAEGGFAFIDPYIGAAIGDASGNPIIFTIEQVRAAGADAPPIPPTTQGSGYERHLMEQRAREAGQFR